MYAYCLFCQTVKCNFVAAALEQQGALSAFSPKILLTRRQDGKNELVWKDFLPGYVFAFYSEEDPPAVSFSRMPNVLRILGDAEDSYRLTGSDLTFALRLLEREGRINGIQTREQGDRVLLDDPLFLGLQGEITRIDRRKQRARVDFIFNQTAYHTWVSLADLQN